jgi:PTH1 family peptidyl-tRNA hydrolase
MTVSPDAAEAIAPSGDIELVVGLGNVGEQYADTRHNVGFRVADELARRFEADGWVHLPRVDATSAWRIPRLLLAKPTTLMNRSGSAVTTLLDRLRLPPHQMLIVVDDVDLDLGTLRLRASGGPGTHNGLRDVCDHVGTDFPRLRLGVRGPSGWDDLASYVLSPFGPDETPDATAMVNRAADAVEAVLDHGVAVAMSRFNGPPAQPEGIE